MEGKQKRKDVFVGSISIILQHNDSQKKLRGSFNSFISHPFVLDPEKNRHHLKANRCYVFLSLPQLVFKWLQINLYLFLISARFNTEVICVAIEKGGMSGGSREKKFKDLAEKNVFKFIKFIQFMQSFIA